MGHTSTVDVTKVDVKVVTLGPKVRGTCMTTSIGDLCLAGEVAVEESGTDEAYVEPSL